MDLGILKTRASRSRAVGTATTIVTTLIPGTQTNAVSSPCRKWMLTTLAALSTVVVLTAKKMDRATKAIGAKSELQILFRPTLAPTVSAAVQIACPMESALSSQTATTRYPVRQTQSSLASHRLAAVPIAMQIVRAPTAASSRRAMLWMRSTLARPGTAVDLTATRKGIAPLVVTARRGRRLLGWMRPAPPRSAAGRTVSRTELALFPRLNWIARSDILRSTQTPPVFLPPAVATATRTATMLDCRLTSAPSSLRTKF
mmetsp:Transcript_31227/g.64711  ORF Transcript_31227/g.64711 Transcript_31227/m.64711 type:complete len:258 (-) Transcript_31227:4-777(-)